MQGQKQQNGTSMSEHDSKQECLSERQRRRQREEEKEDRTVWRGHTFLGRAEAAPILSRRHPVGEGSHLTPHRRMV